ncbi:MAG: AsmA family protein [Bacteroidetes bacterium]|nr:AsmA family protein [Bacteroidota bacterium]
MKKFLKRFLIILAIFFGVVLIAAAVIASIFEKQIGNKLISEINKQLNSELSVSEFDISIFSGFPKASANLREVTIGKEGEADLLKTETVAFRFGLFSLFGSSIKVESVLIENGALNVLIDKRGRGNYKVLKEKEQQTAEAGGGSLAITLKEAKLKNIELIYSNEKEKVESKTLIEDAVFSGEFSSKNFSLSSLAKLKSNYLSIDDKRFLVGTDMGYEANLMVNLKEGTYDFQDVELAVASNLVHLDGLMEVSEENTHFDLIFNSDEAHLEGLFQLLPEEYLEYFNDFTSRGVFQVNGTLKGNSNERENPAIDVKLAFEDGKISSEKLEDAFKDVSFKATFSNGTKQTNASSVLEISDLKGYFNRELTEVKFRLNNLDDPYIYFLFDGTLPLNSIYGLFDTPSITKGGGEIEIKRLELKGSYKDMLNPNFIARVEAGGQIELDDASLTINGEKMIVDRGEMILKNNELKIEGVKIEGAGSEILLEGSCYNLLPVLFADSLNSKDSELEFEAHLRSPNLDLDRLMKLNTLAVSENQVSEEIFDSLQVEHSHKREQFTKFLKGVIDVQVDAFDYNKIEGKSFGGKLDFNNNELSIKGETDAMEGHFELDGNMSFKDAPHLRAKLKCNEINIKDFFYQTENFGQDVLQDENVSGILTSQIAVSASWDAAGNFLHDQLRILAGVAVKNGELKRFKLLEDFSDFIKLQDLRHIKFVNMQNWLEYKKHKLYLPAMFIQSNALNLTVNGEHSTKNEINYNIKINAGQVLSSKLKKFNPGMEPQKTRRKGWFNLYYNIYGTVDKFEVETAKKRVKAQLEQSERRKRTIQEVLNREFGQEIKFFDEPADWKDIPEYDNSDPDEVEYIDWEEG